MIIYCILERKPNPYVGMYMLPEQVAQAASQSQLRPKINPAWPPAIKNLMEVRYTCLAKLV